MQLEAADHALADGARRGPRLGPRPLEEAARARRSPATPTSLRELHLVQVVDRPGTEEDEAVFRAVTDTASTPSCSAA